VSARVRWRRGRRCCCGMCSSRWSAGRWTLRLRARPLSCWFRNRLARGRGADVVFIERGMHSAVVFGQAHLEPAHLGGRRQKVRVQLDLGFLVGLLVFENERLECAGGGCPFRIRRRLDKDLVDVGGGRIEFERILGDGLVIIEIAPGEDTVGRRGRGRRWCRRCRRLAARGRGRSRIGVGRGWLRGGLARRRRCTRLLR